MRIMNLPPFPGEGHRVSDLGEHVQTRLSLDTVPRPDHAWRLLAHMAWPNDASRRDLWMAAQIGMQLEPEKPSEGEGAPADNGDAASYLPAQNASWEYFRLVGGHAPLAQFTSTALHDEIGKIQLRWARIADIVHLHNDMATGNHMKSRGGASVGKVIELIANNSRVKGRSAATLWATWTEFKDVAHLVTAAILLLADAKVRGEREGWCQPSRLSAYRVVMLAPEAVLAVGKSLQQYGLDVEVHGREDPLLDPETVWRIPDWIKIEALPPPPRKLTTSDAPAHRRARRARTPARR
jgi:hypothetical protein